MGAEATREGAISDVTPLGDTPALVERRALSAVRLGGDPMTVSAVLDAAGRRRSPATMPAYHAGRPPRNNRQLYPADPPTVEEIITVMRKTADDHHGARLRALIVVLWRGGLRVQEPLALGERDLDPRRGSLLARRGKGGRRREIGMDAWGWEELSPWLAARIEPAGRPAVLHHCRPPARMVLVGRRVPVEFRRLAAQAGVRRRLVPRQLRNATPSSSLARACRSTSSSASSATPTSARPASTCRASTRRRSSRPCMPGERR